MQIHILALPVAVVEPAVAGIARCLGLSFPPAIRMGYIGWTRFRGSVQVRVENDVLPCISKSTMDGANMHSPGCRPAETKLPGTIAPPQRGTRIAGSIWMAERMWVWDWYAWVPNPGPMKSFLTS